MGLSSHHGSEHPPTLLLTPDHKLGPDLKKPPPELKKGGETACDCYLRFPLGLCRVFFSPRKTLASVFSDKHISSNWGCEEVGKYHKTSQYQQETW